MSLFIATEGVCQGHECDGCRTCVRGRCCRKDNPQYELPRVGTWAGTIYGELGVLRTDPPGEKVQCHACGEHFVALGIHAWLCHDLTAQEYRAIFGLRQRTGLAAPAYKQEIRERNSERLRRVRPAKTYVAAMTPEQHSALKKGTELPLETRLDPRYRATMQRVGTKTTSRARLYPCGCGCGALLEPGNGPHRGTRYLRGHVPPTLADRVEHALREAGGQLMSCREMLDVFPGEEESQVRRALVTLVRQGRVVRPGRGLYAPAEKKE